MLFCALTPSVEAGSKSATIRRESLIVSRHYWAPMRTNRTCLCCLRRPPEHVLDCGHAVCDNCVLIFGRGLPGADFLFGLDRCLICASSLDFKTKIKPPTAGVRVLAADGGGTRGAVALESLCLLQHLLKGLAVQDCFDLALGTSSGEWLSLRPVLLLIRRWHHRSGTLQA